MAETLIATYRVVTPMFIGGADMTPSDGLRPPSFKGALRFWWRALNWCRFRAATSCDETALMLLHDEEARLFGIAAGSGRDSGQGTFLLRILRQPKQVAESTWPQNNTGSGYLGYGLMATQEKSHRQAIREGVEFDLQLRFKPGTQLSDLESIRNALEALSLFGGLGSRARRGFGSLTLLRLDDQDMSMDVVGFDRAVRTRIESSYSIEEFPPYTAFSRQSCFKILANGHDARQAHRDVGLRYKQHRGQDSELRGTAKIPFGLPLQGIDQDSRRASPLIFHVHALRDGQFAASVLYLPAVFHHDSRYQSSDLDGFYREVSQFMTTEERAA